MCDRMLSMLSLPYVLNLHLKKGVVEEENASIKPVLLLKRTKQQCAVWDNAIQVEISATGVLYLSVLYFQSILTEVLNLGHD